MPSTTEQELRNEVWTWELDKCRVLCKMIRCCPENMQERVDNDQHHFEEEGIAHNSMRYYLTEHFKKLEEENGKDES